MPHEVLTAQPAGALVMIGVRPLEAYEKNGVGRRISCIGLVDTGASSTAIAPVAARRAGLIPSDVMFVRRAGKATVRSSIKAPAVRPPAAQGLSRE